MLRDCTLKVNWDAILTSLTFSSIQPFVASEHTAPKVELSRNRLDLRTLQTSALLLNHTRNLRLNTNRNRDRVKKECLLLKPLLLSNRRLENQERLVERWLQKMKRCKIESRKRESTLMRFQLQVEAENEIY